MSKHQYNVAIVGATGAVGTMMLRILKERNFPIGKLRLLASERSRGKKLTWGSVEIPVEVLDERSFQGIDIALFSAGADRSRQFAPAAVRSGARVIDNTSCFRMDPEVPLVVPEVNGADIKKHKGIIANPNCSTIGMVLALNPIHQAAKIKRVAVSTYQSVSGAGGGAIGELEEQTRVWAGGGKPTAKKLPHPIAFNCIPRIDDFTDSGFTQEEMKMVNETKKILHAPDIQVAATCVRVPVFYSHSESVEITTERRLSVPEVRKLLGEAPGVEVWDDPASGKYPMPLDVSGSDLTYVGRIRKDLSDPQIIHLWLVCDNLRKGAALNAIQIAEAL